jgi:meso-butanediol dehydrogenase/(S,S)-butanediol dehydrogenase/diacetyl reductase
VRLKDKVCIVTGGGSGIGRATCLIFAREGARVVVADKRKEAAEAVAAEGAAIGATMMPMMMDVSRDDDAERVVEQTVKAFGRLDVLVNNAGYGFAGTVVDTDEQAWEDLMAVNVRGVFLCSKHAIPAMAATGGGVIVNTASVVAAVGIRNRAAYCASKGAVAALTRAIAIDHVGPISTRSCARVRSPRIHARRSKRANSSAGSARRRRSQPASSFSRATKAALPQARSSPSTAG